MKIIEEWAQKYLREDFKNIKEFDSFINELNLLGFSKEQSLAIIMGLWMAHLLGGDAGGPYSDFVKEALPDAIDLIRKQLISNYFSGGEMEI